ncbi:MAG: FAD-dependent oxidoreductase [Flavobacteriales bacterium]|nr:FAD-dependent oxidoreductase [Flavobacteriales bacterium]
MANQLIKTDICIVGGGITGCALAAYLGQTTKKTITVIEKDWQEADRIVGELLQPGGVHLLEKLGLGKALDNLDAQPVTGYSIYNQGKAIHIDYPLSKGLKPGYGFRNGRFVQNMRALLEPYSNVQRIEGNVTGLIYANPDQIEGAIFSNPDGSSMEVRAELTIVSDGIFSKLRPELSLTQQKITGFFAGLILEQCELPQPGHGHVFITDSTPFVVYPVATGQSRMLIDIPGDTPPKINDEFRNQLKKQIFPYLPESLKPSFIKAVETDKIKLMPNHKLHPSPAKKRGVVIIGDAFNMRHPLTGGGMTVAFTDVYHLARNIEQHLKNGYALTSDQYINDFYNQKSDETGVINILADALYKVVQNPILADACFNYMKQGGEYASGPISLLSGIVHDKRVLMKHFSGVAKYAMAHPRSDSISKTEIAKESLQIIRPLYLPEKPLWHHNLLLQLSKPFIKDK